MNVEDYKDFLHGYGYSVGPIMGIGGTQIIALIADSTNEYCPLCNSDAVIEACTTIKIKSRSDNIVRVLENYRYFACDNPECEFEYVNEEQAIHNESTLL